MFPNPRSDNDATLGPTPIVDTERATTATRAAVVAVAAEPPLIVETPTEIPRADDEEEANIDIIIRSTNDARRRESMRRTHGVTTDRPLPY